MKVLLCCLLFITTLLQAHFQVIMPDNDIVTTTKKQTLNIVFMHPFEQNYMNMEKPNYFGYFMDGKKVDLTNELKSKDIHNHKAWTYSQKFKEIGDYQFFVDPKPYFEPSEGKFIRHITKVIIDAYNAGEGWDIPIGLKVEIVPLVRPYGLYKGNIFSGTVLYKGKPVPHASLEVEHYNSTKLKAPTDMHITQVIKADSNGVFHFVMPKAGWWGFAALLKDNKTIKKDGQNYPVELGALIWVRAY